MLNTIDMSTGSNKEFLTKGTFYDFYLEEGSLTSFDINKAKIKFMNMVKKYPLTLY
jgi:hypothetical protein